MSQDKIDEAKKAAILMMAEASLMGPVAIVEESQIDEAIAMAAEKGFRPATIGNVNLARGLWRIQFLPASAFTESPENPGRRRQVPIGKFTKPEETL